MTGLRLRAERAATTATYGLATGLAGALTGGVTGGLGWALLMGGTTAVAGAQVGRSQPDRATRRHTRLTNRTAGYLSPLRHDGWRLLHARAIGQDSDRVYHLCVPPSANLVVVCMDWAWPEDTQVRFDDDGLQAGGVDGDIAVDWVLHAANTVAQALDGNSKELGHIGVAQALPVHGAGVANGGHVQFHREHGEEEREINVLHASVLADKLRTVPTQVTRRTRRTARDCADVLDTAFP
ncbi:hypothetical protein ACF1AE_21560 [Streptomyces sp. NPDC014986]|uniref:hypothetical protein n=1 Tax=Streptomyces sp. NPDC014986 TaxID=3364934 RepID=UPI0036FBADB5